MNKERALPRDDYKTLCGDGGMHNPPTLPCPCDCGGTLEAGGRNVANTLTFITCDWCCCTFVAYDIVKSAETTPKI